MSSILSVVGGGNVGGGSFYPYSIDQSLRFNDNDSAYLSRTPASAGNRKTWTLSMWVKRANLGVNTTLFSAGTASNNQTKIRFVDSDNSIFLDNEVGGSTTVRYYTSNLFRDVSSWYHFVFEVDTTQATDADKVKIYVNGEQVTSFSSTPNYPSLNEDLFVNNTNVHYIGRELGTGYLDAYLAEVHLIDGTALDATSFGETINGIWVPKNVSGLTYGTNGFYLPFDDSSAIGDDESGNTNDWTANNLAASDVVPDSPTNNFATWNSAGQVYGFSSSTASYSDGNLKCTPTTSQNGGIGTFAINPNDTQGYYWEIIVSGATTNAAFIGIIAPEGGSSSAAAASYNFVKKSVIRMSDGQMWYTDATNGTGGTVYTTWTNGDIMSVAYKDGKIWVAKNGTWMNSGDPAAGTGYLGNIKDTSLTWYPYCGYYNGTYTVNFGQEGTFAGATTAGGNADGNGFGDFKYAPPSGFLALCSANLPEPTISPNAAEQADDYFNTVLYTGNSGTGSPSTQAITGVGFEPSFLWVKDRTSARNHILIDQLRGDSTFLKSNATDAEVTNADVVASLDTDGFTVGNAATCNFLNNSYVAWSWKAGGTAVSNTDGSITSQVSAAPDAGFAICTWTGNATAGATVGHGLGVQPSMIITKNRDNGSEYWSVYHKDVGNTAALSLNSTAAAYTSSAYWNNTSPTSSVFSIGSNPVINQSGSGIIAYCFANTEGYLKCGSYVGNYSTDGPFVYTGFKPAFVLIKATGYSYGWVLFDTARSTYNYMDDVIYPHLSNAEDASIGAANSIDAVSNGFKIRANWTAINDTYNYIYIAFAEAPFKYSLAR